MNHKTATKKNRPLRATDAEWAAIKTRARHWAKANDLTGHKAGVSEYVRHAALNFAQPTSAIKSRANEVKTGEKGELLRIAQETAISP